MNDENKSSKGFIKVLVLFLLLVGVSYMVNNYLTYSDYFNVNNSTMGVGTMSIVTLVGIALLLLLVLYFKVHAFISLLIGSVLVGIGTGMPLPDIIKSIQNGMGSTLGFVATVVGLGAIFGQILESSGGAESLSRTLVKKFGKEKASWALLLTGFIVAIPVFFDVGFIILVPLVYSLAKESKKSVLYYGIPLLAGLAVTHAFVPPTPGPVAVATLLGADLGAVILMGIIIGIPTAIIAGPVFGSYISKKIYINPNQFIDEEITVDKNKNLPSFISVFMVIVVPLALILLNTATTTLIGSKIIQASVFSDFVLFIGSPFIALTIATLIAFYVLGTKQGFSKDDLLELSNKSFTPIGLIILVTGAGGVFKQILVDSGVGALIASTMSDSNLPIMAVAFIVASLVRVSQGSATVAMITSAGIVAPILETIPMSEFGKALVVISIASGSTILSHVNDSGFWLIGRYFKLDVKQTFASWTVMETLIAILGFIFASTLSIFIA